MAKSKRQPHHKLFALFQSVRYNRYTFVETQNSREPTRRMHYHHKMWEHEAAA